MNPASSRRLVVSRPDPPSSRSTAYTIVMVVGLAFFVVGLVDLVLLWIPVRFQSAAWEFATVGRTLDAVPMPALGLTLVVFGSLRHSLARLSWWRSAAALFTCGTVLFCALAILFATSAPAILAETPPEAMAGIRRAAIRHGVQAAVYPVCFAIASAFLWKSRPER